MSTPITYEPYGGLDFLWQQLNTLAPGGAHNKVAPIDVTTPCIVYASATGNDLMVIGAQRIWNDGLYTVTAQGPMSEAEAVYALAGTLDATLHGRGGVIVANGGVLMLSCTREQTIDLNSPLENGMQWLQVGGIYRLYNQAIS